MVANRTTAAKYYCWQCKEFFDPRSRHVWAWITHTVGALLPYVGNVVSEVRAIDPVERRGKLALWQIHCLASDAAGTWGGSAIATQNLNWSFEAYSIALDIVLRSMGHSTRNCPVDPISFCRSITVSYLCMAVSGIDTKVAATLQAQKHGQIGGCKNSRAMLLVIKGIA
jgi:hypothetical protein